MSESRQIVDVVIVGGGGAGLAAALNLGRARRSVVVIDAGRPRNAPAAHMHGYLGHEGLPPGELLAIGRAEVTGYGVEVRNGHVDRIERHEGDDLVFTVHVDDGHPIVARRILLATGVVDELPNVLGLVERWGRDVIHCPYCHGYEFGDQPIVVLATGAMSWHQATMFRQWTRDLTVNIHDPTFAPDDATRQRLEARDVGIVEGPAVQIVAEHDALTGVVLADGSTVPAAAVVVAPRAAAPVVPGLGLAVVEGPMGAGVILEADAMGASSVPGVYVAGNSNDLGATVLRAAAAGSFVGAVINMSLIEEETTAAVAARSLDQVSSVVTA
jgi:thioredoxin reductase